MSRYLDYYLDCSRNRADGAVMWYQGDKSLLLVCKIKSVEKRKYPK